LGAYDPTGGSASLKAQYKGLNSEDAITSNAFHKINGVTTGHNAAAEIPDPAMMIDGYIGTSPGIRSKFSSQSPSLLLVLCYAEVRCNNRRSAHVCVVDTYKMLNGVCHVPILIHVGLASGARRTRPLGGFAKPFLEEYLVHGVVSGAAISLYRTAKFVLILSRCIQRFTRIWLGIAHTCRKVRTQFSTCQDH
jgi:hypothetical protein